MRRAATRSAWYPPPTPISAPTRCWRTRWYPIGRTTCSRWTRKPASSHWRHDWITRRWVESTKGKILRKPTNHFRNWLKGRLRNRFSRLEHQLMRKVFFPFIRFSFSRSWRKKKHSQNRRKIRRENISRKINQRLSRSRRNRQRNRFVSWSSLAPPLHSTEKKLWQTL